MNDEDRRGDAASVAAADDRDQAQRREFGSLLEQHLLRFYGERLARGGGDELQVIGSRPDADGLIVTSQVVRREGPPISVAWRLADANGVYKITDVTIDGVSMALSERAEFSARIARDGGQFDGLLATLRREGPAVGSSVPPPYPSTASGD
jgi:phospholipid transport system substrate-binding protein